MIGRRHFRIKVLQALYAYFQGGEARMEAAEKQLFQSIDKFHELYVTILSFYLEVIHFYRFRLEEAKTKFYPTPDELNPSYKLSENKLILLLEENEGLKSDVTRYRISWTEEQEMVRKVYQKLKTGKDLVAYLASDENGFPEDQAIAEKIFRKYIARSADLQFFLSERYLFWEDDFDVAALLVAKTLKLIPGSFRPSGNLAGLLAKEEEGMEDDRKFLSDLFRNTIFKSEEYDKLIDERTRNWELERIALTDIILIKMALTELTTFTQIPVKVTLNEYIEISKQFSSQKSKSFINGILDKLVTDLTEGKQIRKTGRGLIT